jgi:hypothetical protein
MSRSKESTDFTGVVQQSDQMMRNASMKLFLGRNARQVTATLQIVENSPNFSTFLVRLHLPVSCGWHFFDTAAPELAAMTTLHIVDNK